MRILIIGRTGQLARELAEIVWPEPFKIAQTGREQCDLANPAMIEAVVRSAAPDIVINASGYTAVDRAESEPDIAARINGEAPGIMARLCAGIGASLIHVSTDYVFDGTDSVAYREDHAVHPLSVYGQSKVAGEAGVRDASDRHVIVRTSWVFSSHGNNFVKTMLRLGSQSKAVRVVADQVGLPTGAVDLARAIRSISVAIAESRARWGTYHFAGAGPTSWFEFAKVIFERSGLDVAVEPITTADFGAPARRPANSVLDCSLIRRTYGIEQPAWRDALELALAQMGHLRGKLDQ